MVGEGKGETKKKEVRGKGVVYPSTGVVCGFVDLSTRRESEGLGRSEVR